MDPRLGRRSAWRLGSQHPRVPDCKVLLWRPPCPRSTVPRDGREFTSIYFYPGHYWAKLLADEVVVREHSLLIPTDGWLGLVEVGGPTPLYVTLADRATDGVLEPGAGWWENGDPGVATGEMALSYFLVGGFPALSDRDFVFTSEVRMESSGVCRKAQVILIGQHGRISIPLSIPGCTADLNVVASERQISGRNTDLSRLGLPFDGWHRVSVDGKDGLVNVELDGRQAYQVSYDESLGDIVGIRFRFMGQGMARNAVLATSSEPGTAL
ncbi:MAG: hypothetical protein ACI80V_002919 [Rhodothermales bacterium]|jgi:hypothetical protein